MTRTRILTITGGLVALSGGVALAVNPGTPQTGSAGALDTTFAGAAAPVAAGMTLGPVGSEYRAVAVQRDGKIVAVGESGTGTRSRMVVARYLRSGKLDRRFGSRGIVRLAGSSAAGGAGAFGTGVVVRRDGRILVAGGLRSADADAGMVVVRLRSSGSVDRAFGRRGQAFALTGSQRAGAGRALTVDSNARIVVTGTANSSTGSDPRATAVRFRSNGRLDTGFARRGVFQARTSGASTGLAALATAGDRIVVGGSTRDAFGVGSSLLFRLTSSGTLDRGFAKGLRTTSYARNGAAFSEITSLARSGSANVIAAGTALNRGSGDAFITKLSRTGQVVRAFGSAGVVRAPVADPNGQVGDTPPPGAYGLAIRGNRAYVGMTVEASGRFRLLGLSALNSATGRAVSGFGAAVGPEYAEGLPFAQKGTTYTFVHGRSDAPYSGPEGQTNALAMSADGSRLVAVGSVGPSLGTGSSSSSRQGFVLSYRSRTG